MATKKECDDLNKAQKHFYDIEDDSLKIGKDNFSEEKYIIVMSLVHAARAYADALETYLDSCLREFRLGILPDCGEK